MSGAGFAKREFPLGGEDAKRLGGRISGAGSAKREFPLGGRTRSVWGAE